MAKAFKIPTEDLTTAGQVSGHVFQIAIPGRPDPLDRPSQNMGPHSVCRKRANIKQPQPAGGPDSRHGDPAKVNQCGEI
jgi:hypothetical protein